jgi:hypothetical protein
MNKKTHYTLMTRDVSKDGRAFIYTCSTCKRIAHAVTVWASRKSVGSFYHRYNVTCHGTKSTKEWQSPNGGVGPSIKEGQYLTLVTCTPKSARN